MKVVIIGAGGFVGKNLSDSLLQDPDLEIVCFSKTGVPESKNLKSIVGDFEDQELIHKTLKHADIVYHLISGSIPSTSWERSISLNLLQKITLRKSSLYQVQEQFMESQITSLVKMQQQSHFLLMEL